MKHHMSDGEVIAHLASGSDLLFDNNRSGAEIVTRHGSVTTDQVNRLGKAGWIKWFPSGGGAGLSDAGRAAYIKSTDELGDGVLCDPE